MIREVSMVNTTPTGTILPTMLILFIFIPALDSSMVGIMVPVGVVFTMLTSRIMYKKGML